MNHFKQIKKTILLSVIILTSIIVKAQSNDFFIKKDGTKVQMYGEEARMEGNWIFYTDNNNKKQSIKDEELKLIYYGGQILINQPTLPKSKRTSMHFVMAFNDKYVLTAYSPDAHNVYLNVFDREFNFINDKKIFLPHGSRKGDIQKRKEIYNENVLQYFKSCVELNEAIFKNIEESRACYKGINYYNCNNSLDLFSDKEVNSSEVNNDITKVEQTFYVNKEGKKIEIKEGCKLLKIDTKFRFTDYTGVSNVIADTKVNSEDIKYIYYDKTVFVPMDYKGKKQLMEIVSFNDKYSLLCSYKYNWMGMKTLGESISSFIIYDRNTNTILDELKANEPIKPLLENYFSDCSKDLLNLIDENKKTHRGLTFGFSYLNCNNAKELIEGIEFE